VFFQNATPIFMLLNELIASSKFITVNILCDLKVSSIDVNQTLIRNKIALHLPSVIFKRWCLHGSRVNDRSEPSLMFPSAMLNTF